MKDDVRFGSLADISERIRGMSALPLKADMLSIECQRPLSANSGHLDRVRARYISQATLLAQRPSARNIKSDPSGDSWLPPEDH